MPFQFLNPLMLLGLAGVALPVIAHLLSKRKFDVVEWGAMQFLDPGRKKRRRIRLEQLLLLLLRIGLIALIAFAFARPWVAGGILQGFASHKDRDVALIIDGSYSMDRQGQAQTPHAAAVQAATEIVNFFGSGDSVGILEAHERPRPIIDPPTRNRERVATALEESAAPAGSANLLDACRDAVDTLGRTSNLDREVIVVTDGQAHGWKADDRSAWDHIDRMLNDSEIRPRLFVMDVGGKTNDSGENYVLENLELSREMTVPRFPINISSRIRCQGVAGAVRREVYLEVDGQRMSDHTQTVTLQPDGEVGVEFEYRFKTLGSHLVSVVLDDDALPGDNRSDAAIQVVDAIPVLLVDGDWNDEPTRRESFFAQAALSASGNTTPWINTRVIRPDELNSDALRDTAVVILANVESPRSSAALRDFVSRGGGLLMAAGSRVNAPEWNALAEDETSGFPLPARLLEIRKDGAENPDGIHVSDNSLQLPWLERFREAGGGGLSSVRFSHWWHLEPRLDEGDGEDDADSSTFVAARLTSLDPLLVMGRFQRGRVAVLSVPLDADWSTLPARPDYVPLLHEMIFQLTSNVAIRNVTPGQPLVIPAIRDVRPDDMAFFGPGDTEFDVELQGDELRPLFQLSSTQLPGIYRFGPRDGSDPTSPEYFVVDFDRSESDLTPLSEEQRKSLAGNERVTFVDSVDDLKKAMFAEESKTEVRHLFLFAFLGMLIWEVFMTRRLVRAGHVHQPEAAE